MDGHKFIQKPFLRSLNIHIFPASDSGSCPLPFQFILSIFFLFSLIVWIVSGQLSPAAWTGVIFFQPWGYAWWVELVIARQYLESEPFK